jgi:VWFA-related protein
MRRFTLFCFVLSSFLTARAGAEQDPQRRPIEIQAPPERVEVNLVMLETLVLDGQGRTVPDLTKDDFELLVKGRAVPIDVLDVTCSTGALPDPGNVEPGQRREIPAPDEPRRLVLLIDYYHLGLVRRGEGIGFARSIVLRDKAPREEIMIAALANGLRIEQGFTSDTAELLATLDRMEYDTTLYAREFGSVTNRPFFDNLATLMDVLAEYSGPKAVVMFSLMLGSDLDWDLWYGDIAQRAAVGRVVLYPVWVAGLQAFAPGGGSPALARLANESGGRLTRNTNDLTLAYARAQRDLACRYAVGFYVERKKMRWPQRVRIRVKRPGLEIRSPEEIKVWSEEDRRTSRIRAAFADPNLHEDPLVRAGVLPIRPRSEKRWDTLLVVHFPQSVGAQSASRDVAAILSRGHLPVEHFREHVEFETTGEDESGVRPVTVYGEARLKPGPYTLTVVLAEPGADRLQTTQIDVEVPEVPLGRLFLRGPLLARAGAEGVLRHAGRRGDQEHSTLVELAGDVAAVQPLLVNEIATADRTLVLWEACLVAGESPAGEATIERRVLGVDGSTVHRFEPLPLDLRGGKKVLCQSRPDAIEPGTLAPGPYRLEIAVRGTADAVPLALGTLPFLVRPAAPAAALPSARDRASAGLVD